MRLIVLTGILFSLTTHAQTGLEILKKSADKIKGLKTIRYNIYSDGYFGKATADVSISRGNKELPIFEIAKLKIKGMAIDDNGSREINLSFNGNTFDFLDTKDNHIVMLDSPTYNKLGRTGVMQHSLLALAPYWQKDPFEMIFKQLTEAERVKDTSIYGAECFQVRILMEVKNDFGDQTLESYWFIDKKQWLICGTRSKTDEKFLKILTVDESFDENYYKLTTARDVKTITGKETIGDGLLRIGTKAPGWKLVSSNNKVVKLEDLKGKVLLLDFWGTWCVPCLKAMPDIQSIHEEFKGKLVEIIGISVESEKAADPIAYVRKKGYSYTFLLGGENITRQYKVSEFPSLYIIDKKGVIIHAEHSGGRENFREDIIKRIQSALQ